jgi:DNA-binding winged helix-turn-helix (wHTH) protein/TolB-like protein/tetratricopeptide (TPR) repeat protein
LLEGERAAKLQHRQKLPANGKPVFSGLILTSNRVCVGVGMDTLVDLPTYLFDDFLLDRDARALYRLSPQGERTAVPVGSRAFDILLLLIDRRGEFVSKREILETVWPNTAVEDSNLTVQMASLRRILDAGRTEGSCIQTVPGHGYRFVPNVTRGAKATSVPHSSPPSRQPAAAPFNQARALLAGGIVLMAIVSVLGWWVLRDRIAPSPGQAAATADRRQSAIVMPFESSSGDPAQDELAVTLTGDLTDRLALGNLPVVPEVTASAYRGKPVDVLGLGRKYDVHFALVGNVRGRAGHIVSSATAYEIARGKPIWSRQFDLPDGPGVLTALTQKIYEGYWQTSLDVEVSRAMSDHPDRLDKRDLMNAVLATRLTTPTKEHYLEKMSLVERALALDPNDLQALERQARLHAEFVIVGFSSDPAADLAIADQAADRLLTIDPNNLLSLRAKTNILCARGDWPAAEAAVRKAIELQPTEAVRHYELGYILMAEGRHQEALQSFQAARDFAGGSDPVYLFEANIAAADVALGRLAEAITLAQRAASGVPPNTGRFAELPWLALIAARTDSGNDDEGHADLQKFLATPRFWHSMSQVRRWPAFAANQNLLTGLHNAGMPAE